MLNDNLLTGIMWEEKRWWSLRDLDDNAYCVILYRKACVTGSYQSYCCWVVISRLALSKNGLVQKFFCHFSKGQFSRTNNRFVAVVMMCLPPTRNILLEKSIIIPTNNLMTSFQKLQCSLDVLGRILVTLILFFKSLVYFRTKCKFRTILRMLKFSVNSIKCTKW